MTTNSVKNRKMYNFQFGYHGPDHWESARNDPEFDCESTGLLKISASKEKDAYEWGISIARWYTEIIHTSEYQWSPDFYYCGITKEPPSNENFDQMAAIEVGQYPDLEAMRAYLAD